MDLLKTVGFLQSISVIGPYLAFLQLRTQNDALNSSKVIQFVLKNAAQIKQVKDLQLQSYLEVSSSERETTFKGDKQSWLLGELKILSPSVETILFPLGKKNLHIPASESNLILRSPETQKKILARSRVCELIHEYFRAQSSLNFESPRLISCGSESGADLFEISNCSDKKTRYLSQSPQLYKQRLINAGFKSVYEICTYFRNEKFNSSRHMFETTCLDYEQGRDVKTTTAILKDLIIFVAKNLNPLANNKIYHQTDFSFIQHSEALVLLGLGPEMTLDRNAEKTLVQKMKTDFVFVTNYPNTSRPFYTKKDTGFDLLHEKCELASGSERITVQSELIQAAERKGVDLSAMKDYTSSFRLGCSTSSGFGFGLDRFLMVLLDYSCVQDTKYFEVL